MKQFVEVHYYVKDGKRQAFYDAIISSGIAAASRAEEGNENELLLLEIWHDTEAVRIHGETAHFRALAALKTEFVTDTVIRRYELNEK